MMTAGPEIGMAAALIRAEKLATIGAARPIQIEWLDKITAAVQNLHINDAIDQVDRAINTLQSQLKSPKTPDDNISSGWVEVIAALLNATVVMDEGADLGDLIDVLSLFVQSCQTPSGVGG